MATAQPNSTPFERGLWMPAEWEHHEATWLGWPHEKTDWPGKFPAIPWAYAEIVRHLARVERVYLLVQNRAAESHARDILKKVRREPCCRRILSAFPPIAVGCATPALSA